MAPESGVDALREAAPAAPKALKEPVVLVETPTGREAATDVAAVGEDAVPGLCTPTGELPIIAALAPAAAGPPAEVALAGALREALPLDLVMSTAEAAVEEVAAPMSRRPLVALVPRLGTAPREPSAPLVPSV